MQPRVWRNLSPEQRSELLRRPALATDAGFPQRVADIIDRVREGGDDALLDLTQAHDGVRLDALEVAAAEFDAAENALDGKQRAAIRARRRQHRHVPRSAAAEAFDRRHGDRRAL